ncbi:RNA-binding protein, partial [Pseudomonas syringae pv. pisi]
ALAIGKLTMSTDEIKAKNKGVGIELLHYLGDGLWHFDASV